MVFTDGGALDLAGSLWGVSGWIAGRWRWACLVREPASSRLGASSSRLRTDRPRAGAWPWVAREWDTQAVVGSSAPASSAGLWWLTLLSGLVATRASRWRQKFFLRSYGHGVCAGGRGLPGPAASFLMAPRARSRRSAGLWQPGRGGTRDPGGTLCV